MVLQNSGVLRHSIREYRVECFDDFSLPNLDDLPIDAGGDSPVNCYSLMTLHVSTAVVQRHTFKHP